MISISVTSIDFWVIQLSRGRGFFFSWARDIGITLKENKPEKKPETGPRPRGQPAPNGNLSEETFLKVQRDTLTVFDKRTATTKYAPNIKYIFESISAMDELLRSRNIKFMMAIYPDTLQVKSTQFDELVIRLTFRRD